MGVGRKTIIKREDRHKSTKTSVNRDNRSSHVQF